MVKDAAGNIVEVHCTYDPASRGGNSPDGRKVKSTMHWVSAAHAISAEIRLYDKLFTKADPYDLAEGEDVLDNLNPNSLEILTGAKLEPSLANAKLGDRFQFERVGYFCLDPDSTAGQSGLQPHPPAERLLGQDREEGGSVAPQLSEETNRQMELGFSQAGAFSQTCSLESRVRPSLLANHVDRHSDRLRRHAGVLVAGLVVELGFHEMIAGGRDDLRRIVNSPV